MTWLELVRLVFPDADDNEAEDLLWNRTGFPGLYCGDDPAAYFLKQLQEYKVAGELHGVNKLCELCNEPAENNGLCPEHLRSSMIQRV